MFTEAIQILYNKYNIIQLRMWFLYSIALNSDFDSCKFEEKNNIKSKECKLLNK